jgi:hypothetical protein
MRTRWIHAALVLSAAAGPVWAEGGLSLSVDPLAWPRVQARIGLAPTVPLSTDTPVYGLQGGRVLGDYYFSPGPLWGSRVSGGFRATSGLLLSSSGASLSMATVPRPGWSLSITQQSLSSAGFVDPNADSGHAVPYLGVGYTGLSLKGGWGFTADVGLMALSPGSGLRLGRVMSGNQSLDDVLRDMRLTPVLQLGVSYSF